MAQQPTHDDALLAGLRELGPVARDRRVQVDTPLVGESVKAGRRDPLGGGIDVDDSVALPRPRALPVGIAAPQIDDRPTVDRYRDGGADLPATREVLRKRLAHALKAWIACPLDTHFGHF